MFIIDKIGTFSIKKKETKITESPLDFKQAFDYVNQEFETGIAKYRRKTDTQK